MLLLSQADRKAWPLVMARVGFLSAAACSRLPFLLVDLDPENDVIALALLAAAKPGLFIAALYAIALGRASIPGEVEESLSSLGSFGSGGALRRLSLSAECSQRPLPRDIRNAFAEMASRLDGMQAEDKESLTALRPGDRMAGAAVACLLGFGWHDIEPEGAWSRARSAALHFRLAAAKAEKRRLRLELRMAWTDEITVRELTVSVNGRDEVRVPIKGRERMDVFVPISEIDPERNILLLAVKDLVRLCDHEPGGDRRRLGVFLYGLTVELD